ncbi:hypothetical protein MOB40_09810 [Bacillus inaquosorum]|uniref:Uncharacterized protein n=1 Tax=Bacillus inaquosorum KCTC 13429 TaxID=1236548 RepID=A0A9W5PCE4_9BACI|nr:hypothetical protein [Bacillus inaquosorum]RKQ21668.1 hypothetical protein D3797_017935 [Bacillus subtilis]AWM15969.1 hypothetical protein DKG76_03585 [Bacillus inaquosorum]ELS60677.1 hypothetical protein BSI_30770 [Bacillus inaquosorum KCTC 13429]MCY7905205.1 hypothetical protein [Bacillus inaquosorum]MCY7928899.1 hypothetical protein [Bacillus inaquosorum]
MGVKIDKAVYTKTKELMTNIEADKQELNGEKFTCPYCNVELSFRRSGKRQLENRVIDVSPYFRLEKGIEHEEQCEYNTFGQIEIIARKPMALKEFMEKKKNDQYAIRLQVVKKAMAEPPEEEVEGTTANPKGKGDAANKNYKNSGSITPYLSRMKDIMILRSKMEKNTDVKKHLKLEYKSKTISWDKFYFGPEYKDFLVLSKYFRNKPEPKHPICIEGMVKDYQIRTDKKNKKYYSFMLEKPYVKDIDTEGFRHVPSVSLNIYEEHETLIDYMEDNYKKHNKQIIAYGDPYVKVNTSTQNNVKYHNITIWINRTAQVHLFNNVYVKLFGE